MPTQWNPAVCVLNTCHIAGNLNQLSTKQNTWALSVVSSGSQWDFVFLLIATWETNTMVNLRIAWHTADYGRQAYKNRQSCHHHQTSLQDITGDSSWTTEETLGIKNEAIRWYRPHHCCTFVWVLLQNRCHPHDQCWRHGARSARLERELGGELSEIRTRQLQDHRGGRLQSAEDPNISEQRNPSSKSPREPSQHRAQRCRNRPEPEYRHHQKGHHEVHGGKSVSAMLGGVGLLGWRKECNQIRLL